MEALFAQCVLGRRADRSGVLQFKRRLSYTLNSGRPNYLFLLSKISTSGGWRRGSPYSAISEHHKYLIFNYYLNLRAAICAAKCAAVLVTVYTNDGSVQHEKKPRQTVQPPQRKALKYAVTLIATLAQRCRQRMVQSDRSVAGNIPAIRLFRHPVRLWIISRQMHLVVKPIRAVVGRHVLNRAPVPVSHDTMNTQDRCACIQPEG